LLVADVVGINSQRVNKGAAQSTDSRGWQMLSQIPDETQPVTNKLAASLELEMLEADFSQKVEPKKGNKQTEHDQIRSRAQGQKQARLQLRKIKMNNVGEK
jgi:hypothetical protein